MSGGSATIIVLMGVSGAGKTTAGRLLAQELGWSFVEGDDLHPAANVEKMRRGEALDDADRAPWLRALRERIDELVAVGRSAVVACSALKATYRRALARGRPELRFVWLDAPPALLRARLRARRGHYMPASLLESQLETLELPADATRVDAAQAPEAIVATIRSTVGAASAGGPISRR